MNRLDLPQDAFLKPQWFTNALYMKGSGGLRLSGYTKPALRTFDQNLRRIQGLPNVRATWVWYGGEWVRV